MKKLLIGFGILVALGLAALIAIPFLFKDEINASLKLEINKSLNAKVDYGDVDLSLIRSFPNFRFSIDDVSVVGINEFQGDTLAYFRNFNFTIDLMSVFKKETYKILAVGLVEPKIRLLKTKEGKVNWDITKPAPETATPSTEPEAFSLEVKKYSIEHGYIVFDDQQGKTLVAVNDLNFSGKGDASEELYDFETHTNIEALTFKSGAVAYLNQAKIKADNTISVDGKNQKYSFAKNEINVNDLGLLFDGFVQFATDSTYDLDVKFQAKEATFKSILSLIPAVYKKDFASIKTAGTLKLSGDVKGLYSDKTYPAFNVDLQVGNASFQYPDLPAAVNNININANIKKAQGDLDKTLINVQKLHADIGSEPIDARIAVSTPISDPNVDLTVKGKFNLANVPKFYPIEDLKTISGLLLADLTFRGRQSDIEKKIFTAVKATGNLDVTNLVYDSKTTPMPVNVREVKMNFSPQNIALKTLSAKIGKSDYFATGYLENYIAYLFNNGALKGNLNFNSNYFDANEWLKKDSTAKEDQTPKAESEKYFQVPANIDFDLNAKFGKIIYDKLELSNVKGEVKVKDETIYLNDLYADLLGGNATISATYSTAKSATPKVTFAYDIKNFDFQKTYQFVDMAPKIAPIIKYVQGSFSSDLKGSGSLKEDMSVDYNTLQGEGKIAIPSAKIVNLPILEKIAEVTKVKSLSNLSVNNAWTILKFHDGKVAVEPTDIKFGNGYNINFKGLNGFDESIDYDVRFDVPSKELGGTVNSLISQIPGGIVKTPETLNLFLKVGGTAAKPTVKLQKVAASGTSIGDMAKDAVNDLKDKALDEAKKQADALKEQAEQQAKAVAEQAKQTAQKAADEAKRKADEAAQKAKEAADKAKKDAEQKAKEAVKGIKLPFGK